MFIKRLNIIFLPTYCTHTRTHTRTTRAKAFSTRKCSNQDFTNLTKKVHFDFIYSSSSSNRVSFSRRRVKKRARAVLSLFPCFRACFRLCAVREKRRFVFIFVSSEDIIRLRIIRSL